MEYVVTSTGCIYNAWADLRSELPTPKQGKKFDISICHPTLSFLVQLENVHLAVRAWF
jgi:hypothetical protein